MKRLVALAAALFIVPNIANASTHCDYSGGASLPNNVLSPAGVYPVVTNPATGALSVQIPRPTAPSGFILVSLTQLGTLGIPFTFQYGSPLQLSCGSPDSANFHAVADGLDMDFDFDVDGDSDTIGGAVTGWDMGNENGQRFDLKYAKGMQLSEGSRTRLLLTGSARYLAVGSSGADQPQLVADPAYFLYGDVGQQQDWRRQ